MKLSQFEERWAAVIAQINAAFDGVSRGDGITLHEAMAIDNCKSTEDQCAARRLDVERRWQGVSDNDIFESGPPLSFLDQKAFRYYIPALMILGLRHWEDDTRKEFLRRVSITSYTSIRFLCESQNRR